MAHPLAELVLQHCSAYAAYPLLTDLVDLDAVRHIFEDVLAPGVEEGCDALQAQVIVLGHRNMPHVLGLDAYRTLRLRKDRRVSDSPESVTLGEKLTPLLGRHDVLEEINRHLLIRGEIEPNVHGEKVISVVSAKRRLAIRNYK